ncbi:MAG: flagellar basal body L-ring protein FlgH [Alphaproteobacteria bacterium]
MTPCLHGLRVRRLAVLGVVGLTLAACSNTIDRLAAVGETPKLKPIENPTLDPKYEPVSLPMPAPETRAYPANSLWRTGARAFFKDQRAQRVGDILTVLIDIEDSATVKNSTTRTRDNTEGADASAFLGYETKLSKFLPDAVNPGNLVDLNSDSRAKGTGDIQRDDTVNLRVAAIVSQVLPNGNLVIHGTQEVRVNYEVRELLVEGVVRREDIRSDNTVKHDQIAEARIVYGGRGTLSDVQRPRYGQEIFDIIYPF